MEYLGCDGECENCENSDEAKEILAILKKADADIGSIVRTVSNQLGSPTLWLLLASLITKLSDFAVLVGKDVNDAQSSKGAIINFLELTSDMEQEDIVNGVERVLEWLNTE